MPSIRAFVAYASLGLLIATSAVLLNTDRTMSAVWYGPYLSSAENVSWGGDFVVNLREVREFREMSPKDQREYRFKEHHDLQAYIANPIGFSYAIAAAKLLLPWLPDVRALEAFQILVHAVLCLLVIALLESRLKKSLFFVLYAINPLVIYYVTYPFYYFYQAIPSFALIFLLLSRHRWAGTLRTFMSIAFIALCVVLAIVLLMRTTTVAAIAAFFLIALSLLPSRKLYVSGLAAFVAIVVTGYSPSQKNFWHTAYVGIGAYPNAYMQGLSDDNGYALFERRTGVPLNASLGGNYYDKEVMSQYHDITRTEFLEILRSDWPVMLRNAALNTFQGFALGYLVGQPLSLHVAMATAGFVILLLLLLSRQFVVAVLIALTITTFTLYYPPIPAYMYGAYAFLVFGAIGVVEHFARRLSTMRRSGPRRA